MRYEQILLMVIFILCFGNQIAVGAPEAFLHDNTEHVHVVGMVFEFDGDPYPEILDLYFGLTHSDGSGRLRQGTWFPVSGIGEPLPSIDYNNDGLDDLVQLSNGKLRIRLNTPRGTFEPILEQSLPANIVASQVPMHLNADGLADFLVLFDSGAIYHLISNGLGEAYTMQLQAMLSPTRADAKLRDMDGDGDVDAILMPNGSCSLALQGADGSWSITGLYESGRRIDDHQQVDFDLDGDMDIVLFHWASQKRAVLLRNNGGVLEFVQELELGVSTGISDIRVVDMNHDGREDFVYNLRFAGGSQVTGAMIFDGGPMYYGVHQFDEAFGVNIGLGDFDGDGFDELLQQISTPTISGVSREGIGVYHIDDTDQPVERARSYCKVSDSPLILDLQADGDMDILMATGYGSSTVLLNDGLGRFSDTETYIDTGITEFATADLNQDGIPDVAIVSEYTDQLVVRFGDGSGQFPDETRYVVGDGMREIHIADIDQDGDDDLLVTRQIPGVIVVLYNNGSGEFAQVLELPTNSSLPVATRTGDLNQDGVLDIVYASLVGSGRLEVRYSYAGGGYLPALGYETQTPVVKDIVVRDITHDGYPDIILGGVSQGVVGQNSTLSLHINSGLLGILEASTRVESDLYTNRIMLADMNGDGIDDIIQIGYPIGFGMSNKARVFLLNSDGAIELELESELRQQFDSDDTYSIFIQDFDADGDQDLLMFQSYLRDRSVSQFLNNGDGTLEYSRTPIDRTTLTLTHQDYESKFVMKDMDLDGDLDFISGSYDLGVLRVIENKDRNYCVMDLNDDGGIDFFDVSIFIVAFQGHDPLADWNGDGAFDFFDVSGFLKDYQGGCP